MNPFKTFWKTFPALSRMLALCLGLSSVTYVVLLALFRDSRPGLFLLGDSCTGNYRLDAGTRFQDDLRRLLPGWHVENWALPGAKPLDYFLQLTKGEALAGKPRVVVVAMASDKFLGTVHRFDADGENLRYLPVDGTGLACFRRLDEHERNVAGVQRIALPLFLTFDALREAWVQYIQWPHERAAMRASTPKRKAKIADRARQNGLEMEAVTIGSDREWDTLTLARDLEFLFDNSRSRGIIVEAVILPFANPALVDTTWSDSARAKRDLSILRMRTWLEARGVPYVDFNEARHQSHFPEPAWDDVFHLKSPEAYQYMASEIAKAVPPLFVKSCQAGDRHDR